MVVSEFLQGESTIPTPNMSEAKRLKYMEKFRQELRARGMMIIAEHRVRNIVFDKGNERTTFKVKFRPA